MNNIIWYTKSSKTPEKFTSIYAKGQQIYWTGDVTNLYHHGSLKMAFKRMSVPK